MKKNNIIQGFPHFLHGGDYNPDQWLNYPEIIDEDFKLMKASGCNTFSIAIFAWSALEPEEGRFEFEWLDMIMDKMAENNFNVFLATPTGAKPPWMAFKYPETRRVNRNGQREFYQARHNHCWTSPIYREKSSIIISKIAERYKNHPALKAWHISNEYHGECFCDLCLASWHDWLKKRYETLDKFNDAMWTNFWSHKYSDWSQIEPRDWQDGICLNWLRFTTWQLCDFMSFERKIIKSVTPNMPVTTNMMGFFKTVDYWRVAELCDFIADDSYPSWNNSVDNSDTAVNLAMKNDMLRCLKKGNPFIFMESTPSTTNWQKYHRLKRPGIHRLEILQAIAHGADGTMYFQWRKGRGGTEKFHGAVIDHAWGAETRVFKEVSEISAIQKNIEPVLGTTKSTEVAVICDWEIRWAIETSNISNTDKAYLDSCAKHYRCLWNSSIPTDVIESSCPFDKYKLIVAPMLYMLKPNVAEKLAKFVEHGGTVVLSVLSGYVDEHNRCFSTERPGNGLCKLLGIKNEELDELTPEDSQSIVFTKKNIFGIKGKFKVSGICELIHKNGAQVIAEFAEDFYKRRPAVTVNKYGKGFACYIACSPEQEALQKIYDSLIKRLKIKKLLHGKIPRGVNIQSRTDGKNEYFFFLNFVNKKQKIDLGKKSFINMLTGEEIKGKLKMLPFGSTILKTEYKKI